MGSAYLKHYASLPSRAWPLCRGHTTRSPEHRPPGYRTARGRGGRTRPSRRPGARPCTIGESSSTLRAHRDHELGARLDIDDPVDESVDGRISDTGEILRALIRGGSGGEKEPQQF